MWVLGLDIAWMPKNPSGAVLLLLDREKLRVTLELGAWLRTHNQVLKMLQTLPDPSKSVCAIDAPLLPRGIPKLRPVDQALLQELWPYRIGVLPPRSVDLEKVLDVLERIGLTRYPWPPFQVPSLLEVYPQWVSVGIWRRSLIYKQRGLPASGRREAIRRIRQDLQRILSQRFRVGANLIQWLRMPVENVPVRRLVDETDALLCALVPLWLHAGLGIRTIPRHPQKGEPYIITLWEEQEV